MCDAVQTIDEQNVKTSAQHNTTHQTNESKKQPTNKQTSYTHIANATKTRLNEIVQEFLVVTIFISANQICYSSLLVESFTKSERSLFSLHSVLLLSWSIAVAISHPPSPKCVILSLIHSFIYTLEIQICIQCALYMFVCGGTASASAISIKMPSICVWCPCTWNMLVFTQLLEIHTYKMFVQTTTISTWLFRTFLHVAIHCTHTIALHATLWIHLYCLGLFLLFAVIKSITCCIWPVQIRRLIVNECAHTHRWPFDSFVLSSAVASFYLVAASLLLKLVGFIMPIDKRKTISEMSVPWINCYSSSINTDDDEELRWVWEGERERKVPWLTY